MRLLVVVIRFEYLRCSVWIRHSVEEENDIRYKQHNGCRGKKINNIDKCSSTHDTAIKMSLKLRAKVYIINRRLWITVILSSEVMKYYWTIFNNNLRQQPIVQSYSALTFNATQSRVEHFAVSWIELKPSMSCVQINLTNLNNYSRRSSVDEEVGCPAISLSK